MKKGLITVLIVLVFVSVVFSGPVGLPQPPRLVLLLVMDQFRYDFLIRHRPAFVPGGFNLLLERGAVFANCNYLYATTFTAPGHAVIATGTYPYRNGIVGNDWQDPVAGCTTVERDTSQKLVGGDPASPGVSPHYMIGDTLGDELKLATGGRSRVIGISIKARSAMLPAGISANAAFWFDSNTLHAISSTYYMNDLPGWVKQFNSRDWVQEYAGKPWTPVEQPNTQPFLTLPEAQDAASRKKAANAIAESAFITGPEFALARAAIENEKLGQGPATDMLTISVSATDLVGHAYGPDSPVTRDAILRADRAIAGLLRFLDTRIGLGNVWVAFTADHGVAPMPEVAQQQRLDAGRLSEEAVVQKVESVLSQAYPAGRAAGQEKWVTKLTVPHLYLNQALIQKRQLNPDEVARRAAGAALELGGFAATFTRADLKGCYPSRELIGQVCLAYYPPRSGDVYLVYKPYWMNPFADIPKNTTHISPYPYDTHVPLVFLGAPFRPGLYYSEVSPADLAVTMAAALGINAPALATGHVLAEALLPVSAAAGRAKGAAVAASPR